jgi:hypothetical protein
MTTPPMSTGIEARRGARSPLVWEVVTMARS